MEEIKYEEIKMNPRLHGCKALKVFFLSDSHKAWGNEHGGYYSSDCFFSSFEEAKSKAEKLREKGLGFKISELPVLFLEFESFRFLITDLFSDTPFQSCIEFYESDKIDYAFPDYIFLSDIGEFFRNFVYRDFKNNDFYSISYPRIKVFNIQKWYSFLKLQEIELKDELMRTWKSFPRGAGLPLGWKEEKEKKESIYTQNMCDVITHKRRYYNENGRKYLL